MIAVGPAPVKKAKRGGGDCPATHCVNHPSRGVTQLVRERFVAASRGSRVTGGRASHAGLDLRRRPRGQAEEWQSTLLFGNL